MKKLKIITLSLILICLSSFGQVSLVKDINTQPSSSYPSKFSQIDNITNFTARVEEFGTESWRNDGTETGAFMAKDISYGSTMVCDEQLSVMPDSFVPGTNEFYFIGSRDQSGFESYKYANFSEWFSVTPQVVNIGASDKHEATFDINSEASWSIVSSEPWLTVSPSSGSGNATINLTASSTLKPRNAKVTISSSGMPDHTVIVYQDETGGWMSKNNGIYGGYIAALAFDPQTSYIYAGTNWGGIFLSKNNGDTWSSASKGLSGYGFDVRALEINGNNIFAGTYGGIFLSTDKGASWKSVNNGLDIDDLLIHSIVANGSSVFAATESCIYFSSNNGSSWTPVSTGLPDTYINTIALNGNIVFAGTDAGVFLTINNGISWTEANNGLPDFGVSTLEVIDFNIYAGVSGSGGGAYISTDNGTSWKEISNGLPTNSYIHITAFASLGSDLYAGTEYNGIFISSNAGDSWIAVNNGLSGNALIIGALLSDGSAIFSGTYGSGVMVSADNGASWTAKNEGIENNWSMTLSNNASNIFAILGSGIAKSSDNGETWTIVTDGLPSDIMIDDPIVSYGNSVYLLTENYGIYRSLDNGDSWAAANMGLPSDWDGNYRNIRDITVNSTTVFALLDDGLYISNDNAGSWTISLDSQGINSIAVSGSKIFITDYYEGVLMSADSGISWNQVDFGITEGAVTWISAVDDKLFCSSISQQHDSLYFSDDNGVTWTEILHNFPSEGLSAMTVKGSNIFFGTETDGVFDTTDKGKSWTAVNNGFYKNGHLIASLCVMDDYIYAATGCGIWKRPLSEVLVVIPSPSSVNIDYPENSTGTFNLISNVSWDISTTAPWLSINNPSGSDDNTIFLSVQENNSSLQRSATVTISCPGLTDRLVSVTQNGKSTGIEDIKNLEFKVYPNPVSDILYISIDDTEVIQNYSFRIINQLGIIVLEKELISSPFEIDVSGLFGKGIYYIQVFDKNKKIQAGQKVIFK